MSVEALAQLDAKLHHNLIAALRDNNLMVAAQLGDPKELAKRIDALLDHDNDIEFCGYLYLRYRHLVDSRSADVHAIPEALTELLQAFPQSIGLNYLRCEINGRSAAGIKYVLTEAHHLAICIERDPDNPLFWHKLAISYYFGGQPVLARVAAMAASGFARNDAYYGLHEALCHAVSGNEPQARDIIDSMPREQIGMAEFDLYIGVLIELGEVGRAKADLAAFTKAYFPLSAEQEARLAEISERIDSGHRYTRYDGTRQTTKEVLDNLLPEHCRNIRRYFNLVLSADSSNNAEISQFVKSWVDSVEQTWTALDYRLHLETRTGAYPTEERLRYLSKVLRRLEDPRIMRSWHIVVALATSAATSVPQREPVDHFDAQFAEVTNKIVAVYQTPFEAKRIYDFAVSLQSAGMHWEAAGVFTVAYQLQPEVEFIIGRLCCAHEEVFEYERILDRLALHEQKFPLQPVLIYYRFAAYLKRTRLAEARSAYEAIPPVDDLENPGFMPSRAKLMLTQAEKLNGKVGAPLRYWNSVYNDSILTMLSPYGYETMSGFYGSIQDDFSLVREGLERLKIVLAAVGWKPPRVLYANDPRSEVLGNVAATLLGCELTQLTPETFAAGGLVVVFSIELASPQDQYYFFHRTSNTLLFAHHMAYTHSRGVVADIVSFFAEIPRCPWHREYFEPDNITTKEKLIEISPVRDILAILNSDFAPVSASEKGELEVLARNSAHLSMMAAGNKAQNELRMRFWYDFPVSVARFQGFPNLSSVLRIGQRYQA